MNSRDRIFAALKREEPDRIPLMELGIDPRTISFLCQNCSYLDFVEKVGLDAVVISEIRDAGDHQWIDEKKRIFRDRWGTTWRFTNETFPFPIEGPIKSEEQLKAYVPPDPYAPKALGWLPEAIKRFKGEKAIAWMSPGDFFASSYLRGMDVLLMDYLLRPQLAKKIAHMRMEYTLEFHKRLIKEGVEIIVLGDDYAYKNGPMMSPAQFKEFILPVLRKVVANIKDQGAYCIKHTDGNIWKIIDWLIDTGIDGIGPLEPGAGMDLYEVKKKYGNKVCVMGNVDVNLLSQASVEKIVSETKRIIARVSPSGGHIMSSGNSISSSVKPENFLAMVETTKKYGRYPLGNISK